MSDYFFSNGINDNGGNIVLTAPWEHQKSELRCLAIATDKEHQELKVLNGDLILGSNGTYTITYPFETPGLPWAAYLWRETTQNGNPKYENGRIPVEAMLSKLSELSKKADETREFVKRAFMTPEDAEGKMFVPPLEVRKGRLLGFDNSGNPVTGDACPQIAELDEQQKVIEGLAKEANDRALEAANSVILAAEYAKSASNSAQNSKNSADSSEESSVTAKKWHDKTINETALASVEIGKIAGRAEQAEAKARKAAEGAEDAMNIAISGQDELRKVVCYVGCAAGRVTNAEKVVNEKAEEVKRLADEFGGHVGDLSAYPTFNDIRSGVQTQSLLGYNVQDKKQTGNAIYLNGSNMEISSGGHFINIPAKSGTIALLSDLGSGDYVTPSQLEDEVNRAKREESTKAPLLVHTSGTPTNEFDGYGYYGTLRNLGLFGGAVVVSSLGIVTRTGTNQNTNVALWARILKVVNGAWVVAAQSKTSRKWNEVSAGSVLEFEMEHVAGVIPPRDDETIAIVWVNNANAAATVSNGALSFRTTSISGGVAGELPSSPTSGTMLSYSPVFHFKYAPFAGDLSDYAKKTDTAFGPFATAGDMAIAFGGSSTASGLHAVALGDSANALGNFAFASGGSASAFGSNSIALGYSAEANQDYTTAMGVYSTANTGYSVALGYYTVAAGAWATALGGSATASGASSIALGVSAKASENGTTALGSFASASGEWATAVGYQATNSLEGSLLLRSYRGNVGGSLSVRLVAGADTDTSYFDFYHHDQLSGVVTGRRISASNFFSMLDEYGATAEVPDISSGDDYYY